ncbi:HAD family hydrolase [Nocardia asteroides]|uniref:HAD family hydrolase n=1 Tax=Nocardia asteroides TaxID=1824 RepID=UPI001E283939|nr:HAD hydrolase-like protein [Nocardia asteroides]UGT58335.1 HAD hydrolase-like protein [Nocardia asteroides]
MNDLRRLLADRPCLLLDFDGPVCSVFAGISSRRVAEQLGAAMGIDLPPHLGATSDPFELLDYAAQISPEVAVAAEQQLTRLEVEAVALATPTPYTHELIREADTRDGGSVAIVSNNSVAAIDTYLRAHELRTHIAGIYARTSAATRLKPSPDLLTDALASLRADAAAASFTGDSVTDLQAAHSAALPAIAYANKPGKVERFAPYAPAVTITSMFALLDAVRGESISQ